MIYLKKPKIFIYDNKIDVIDYYVSKNNGQKICHDYYNNINELSIFKRLLLSRYNLYEKVSVKLIDSVYYKYIFYFKYDRESRNHKLIHVDIYNEEEQIWKKYYISKDISITNDSMLIFNTIDVNFKIKTINGIEIEIINKGDAKYD